MKKLGIAAIICAAAFLGLVITGGIFIGIGAANLATDSEFMETVKEYGTDFVSMIENATSDYSTYSGSESFEINGDYEAVVLNGFTGDITIRPCTDEMADYTVLVEYNGIFDKPGTDGKHFEFNGNGHTLTISQSYDQHDEFNIGVFNAPNGGEITIYIPQYKYTELTVPLELDLTINDTVGEIEVLGFTFGDITLHNTVGEITFSSVRANMISCENTIGEISAEGAFNGISISDTIGECEVESSTPLTLDSRIEGNIAEVQVSLPAGTQYYFTTSEALGNVIIDDQLRGGSDNVSFNVSNSIGNVVVEID